MNQYAVFEIEFGNTYLPVILNHNVFYVPLMPMIEDIGLDYNQEYKKLDSNYYSISWDELDDKHIDGTKNIMVCIRLSDIDRYFQTIKIELVPEFAQYKLEKYQKYCAKFLTYSLNSSNLYGVVSITTPISPAFRKAVTTYGWNDSALKGLGVYIGEPV